MKKCIVCMMMVVMLLALTCSALAAHTHTFGPWEWEKMPTCQEKGRQVRVCTQNNCSLHERRPVATVEHEYLAATCTKPKTCKFNCGTTVGSPLGHSYLSATCVSPAKCWRCGVTTGDLGTHHYSSATCIKLATCRDCGITKGDYAPHIIDSTGKCTVCHQQITFICSTDEVS